MGTQARAIVIKPYVSINDNRVQQDGGFFEHLQYTGQFPFIKPAGFIGLEVRDAGYAAMGNTLIAPVRKHNTCSNGLIVMIINVNAGMVPGWGCGIRCEWFHTAD